MNLTQAIKAQAHRIGFPLVGVTTADGLPHGEVFDAWLEHGRHGEMGYLNSPRSRACRAQPKVILAECRSVLVFGARYPHPVPTHSGNQVAAGLHGRVASYALSDDYHEFLLSRLFELVEFIELQVGHSILNRYYTDTGPILERELAQRAGLGWIGKNTCLINPQQGSYFLLAEILLSLELEPDPSFAYDRCGTCTRCLQACPTACILPDRTIDARRCISYLTIELKGTIPVELRPLMGDWVFGCDVCQQVCPWNRFSTDEGDPAFAQRLVNPIPNLLEEISLSPAEFKRKYHLTPLMRAKRRGYLRNAAVALGNTHNPSAIPALAQVLLSESEPLVRAHVAWAIGRISGAKAENTLMKAANTETDPQVMAEIQAALVQLGG